jgi:hypothetical protein
MFNIADLKTALAGYIGFRYPVGEFVTIATVLRTSVSGQYWDDFHPLLHTDSIYYTAPKDADFSTWLGERVDASIGKLFSRLQTNKKLQGSTKSIFDNVQLFTGVGKITDQIAKSSRLVGLRITPRNINNIRVVINQIGLQLTHAQTGLPVYLWHSSRAATVDSQVLVTTTTNYFDWKALGFNLDYVNYANDIDSGGSYYIGYFEADLTGNAIRKTYDFYAGPCVSCPGSQTNRTIYNLWSKYVEVLPFSVPNSKLSGTNIPPVEDMVWDETTNYGINLSLTVKPDLTELVTNNLSVVTYPLGLQFASDMLEWMLYNPATRVNPSQMNANQAAFNYALNGDSQNRGIVKDLTDAINGLAEDLSGISTALPQNKPSGIRIGAI